MNENDFNVIERRKFALDKAIAVTVGHDRPQDIVERAEAFDDVLRGDKPAVPST